MPFLCSRCERRFDEPLERCPHDGRRVVRDLSGQTIGGRYRLKSLVGIGGMGSSVWSAWQSSIQREVAVKLLPSTSESAAERFARGARLASNLSHPNITVVHDYGRTVMGDLYLVMELMAGVNLFRASRKERFQLPRVIHMMDLVLRALGHAHRRSVVHRDIKLSNLFWCPTDDDLDFVKVLDFGIARQFNDVKGVVADDEEVEVTAANQLCGTPQYMAPEQIGFDDVDGRADLYAVGIATFHLLTGEFPFKGTPHELFRQHLQAPPPDLLVRSDLPVPVGLAAWVSKALEKSVEHRFSSAEEMREALCRIDLQPTEPLPVINPSMLSRSDIHEPSSEVVTPPPSGTAGEMAEGQRPEDKGQRWSIALALFAAGLGVSLVLMWPGGNSEYQSSDDSVSTVREASQTQAKPPTGKKLVAASTARDDTRRLRAPEQQLVGSETATGPATVRIITEPAGAVVRQDGERLGVTPLDISLMPGEHELRVSHAGYVDRIERVSIKPSESKTEKKVRRISLTRAKKRAARRPRLKRRRESPKSPSRPRQQLSDAIGSPSKNIEMEIKTPARRQRVRIETLEEPPNRQPEIEVLE